MTSPHAAGQTPSNARPHSPGWLTESRLHALLWAFVGLGIGLRLLRFLLRFPLWGDECFVAVNFLDRDFLGLARPLDFQQICPLWFLWLELATVKILGFNEWSLRLFPTICSVASVLLFRQVALRLLAGVPLLLAVAIFCVSYYPIRHGAELKPYSADLFVSLTILSLTIAWLQTGRHRFGWWLAAFMPLGLGLSYPAVFVAAAASGAALLALVVHRLPKGWPAWVAFNAAALLAFAAFYLAVARHQSLAANLGGIHDYWDGSFPPLTTPWKVPLWLLDIATGRMFAYPVGGARGASALTTILCLVGAVILWKRRERWISCLLLGPAAVGLAAAFAHAYPFGDSARIMQYFAPATCLLAGVGLAAVLAHSRWTKPTDRRVAVAIGLLLLIGAGSAVRDLTRPFKTEFDALNQAFARWLWHDLGADGEIACVQGDLGVQLYAPVYWRDSSQEYRCYQRIFSRRHQTGKHAPAWDKITVDHPLWCVVYARKGCPPDATALRGWLAEMSRTYDLAESMRLPLGTGGGVVFEQWYEVYRFVPKLATSGTSQAAAPAAQQQVR